MGFLEFWSWRDIDLSFEDSLLNEHKERWSFESPLHV